MKAFFSEKWRVLIGLALLWLLFTAIWAAYFVAVPTGSTKAFETVRFVFLAISAFGVLFSALLTSFNSLEATSNLQEKLAFDRAQNSFDYISRWEASSLKEARDWTRALAAEKATLSDNDLCARIEGLPGQEMSEAQRGLQRSVITMFNFYEEMELSLQAGRVTDEYLRKAFAQTYDSLYKRFSPWIEKYEGSDQKVHLKSLHKRWY